MYISRVLFVLFTLTSSFPSDWKKSSSQFNFFFQSCECSKTMWSCVTVDTAHAHRSYLTVARLTFAEWRSAFMNCPYIMLFFHSYVVPLIQLCLNPFLFTASLNSVVSATFTPSIKHPSQLIDPLPPISLLRYTLSTSLLGCSAPCIIINFLVLLPKLFNSSVFHFRISAPYLITETAQVSTPIILFLPFNFDLDLSFNRFYSLLNFSFRFFFFDHISFQYPYVCITSLINVFHVLPIW